MDKKETIRRMGKRVFLLNEFDHLISGIFNFSVRMKGLFSSDNTLLKNRELTQGAHDICFVVGNGPSLTADDLKLAHTWPVFTVNYFHKGIPDFVSDYHVCIDPGWVVEPHARDYITDIYNQLNGTKFIFNIQMKSILEKKGLATDRAYFIKPYYVQNGANIRVDMSKIMTGSINVVPVAIECALYMGYKHIYLLGCDMNLMPVHFYDQGECVPPKIRGNGMRATSYAFFHHYELDALAKKTGSEIVNLTRGSFLDAYRMDQLENVIL